MSKLVAFALTWVAATCLAVFVALQAVGAIGDQVTDTANASGRQPGTAAISSPSSTTASTAVTTSPAAPVPAAAADPGAPSGAATGTPAAAGGGSTDAASAPATEAPVPGADPPAAPEQQQEQEQQESQGSSSTPVPEPETPGPITSYSLQGGSIGVRCTGSAIKLVYSSPAQGFAADVNSDGPGDVDVRFESDQHESRIKVQCSSGAPVVTDQREEPR